MSADMYLLSILGSTLIYYKRRAVFSILSARGPASPQFAFAVASALVLSIPESPGNPGARVGVWLRANNVNKEAKTKRWQTTRQAPANKYMQGKAKSKTRDKRFGGSIKRKMFLLTNCKTFAF